MEISLANIFDWYGLTHGKFSILPRQSTMGKSAGSPGNRILRQNIFRYYTARHKEGRRNASQACRRWEDQQLSNAQEVCFFKREGKGCDSSCNKGSDGLRKTVSILSVPNNVENRNGCEDHFCILVEPDVDRRIDGFCDEIRKSHDDDRDSYWWNNSSSLGDIDGSNS